MKRNELDKTLKPSQVWAIALGTIIGFGVFVMPPDLLIKGGPLGASIGIILGALIMILIGRSYGYMISALPVAGGEFAYAYKGFGSTHAYICGWLLTLGYLSIVSLNATALPVLGKFVAPGLFNQGYLYTMAGWDVYVGEILLASTAVILFGIFNYRGMKFVGKSQFLMVVLLVGSVVIIGGGTIISPETTVLNMQPGFNPDKSVIACILSILAIAPWMYVGFDTIPQASEEYDFSPSQSFKLILFAILFGAAMYIVALVAVSMVFPWQETVAAGYVWAAGTAMETIMGKFGISVLVVAMCMAVFTGINGFFMATSRLLFGMARAKILPAWFGYIHPKHKTPSNAIIFVGVISLFAPWFGRQVITWIVDMASLGTSFGYLYTCLAAYLLIKAHKGKDTNEVKISKNTALAGGICSFGFALLLCVPGSPGFMATPCWYALAIWVAMGVIFYFVAAKEFKNTSKGMLDYYILNDRSNLTAEEVNLVAMFEDDDEEISIKA